MSDIDSEMSENVSTRTAFEILKETVGRGQWKNYDNFSSTSQPCTRSDTGAECSYCVLAPMRSELTSGMKLSPT